MFLFVPLVITHLELSSSVHETYYASGFNQDENDFWYSELIKNGINVLKVEWVLELFYMWSYSEHSL